MAELKSDTDIDRIVKVRIAALDVASSLRNVDYSSVEALIRDAEVIADFIQRGAE